MTPNPDSTNFNIITNLLPSLIPLVVSPLAWIITNPDKEKRKIDFLRKNLLTDLRFKIAAEIAKDIPEKKSRMSSDDYIAVCQEKLNDYFSSNTILLTDFLKLDKIYNSYVKFCRIFKYGIVCIPILAILGCIVWLLCFSEYFSQKSCFIGVGILVAVIGILWVIMAKKKDKFSDLCAKYEVVDDESSNK